MTDDAQEPPESPPKVWLHDILAEHDRLGDSVRWMCGDLALRRFDDSQAALEKELAPWTKKLRPGPDIPE